jgi:hypothetical protein
VAAKRPSPFLLTERIACRELPSQVPLIGRARGRVGAIHPTGNAGDDLLALLRVLTARHARVARRHASEAALAGRDELP